MRKHFIRKVVLSVCLAIFMLASIFGVSSLTRVQAETNWQTGVFEMEDGVSLQFSKVGGMRFIVKMDQAVAEYVQDNADVELGFVIAPENLMKEANGDYLNMSKKIGGAIDKNKMYQDGDFWQANGCITAIKYNNLTRDFVAVAYIKSGDEVRYTSYNTLARNNLYDLVNMATLNGYASEIFEAADGFSPYVDKDGDGNEDGDGWYGTEEFPIVIENTTEYNGFVTAVNDGVVFDGYKTVIKNEATPSIGYGDHVVVPEITIADVYDLNAIIQSLPDEIKMPDAIGVIGRIRDAEKKYNALSESNKLQIDNYAKVESLLSAIEGYDRVYKNDATDGTVIPSYVPGGYASTIGGSATTRQDNVYGNVLAVTSNADGKAALYYQNFPSIEKYTKIYFYVKASVGADIYLSDGISNDGWGDDWKNTWSVTGLWCNAGNWRLVEVNVADGYIGANFAIGFRTNTTGFTFEISDFYGYTAVDGRKDTSLDFGTKTDNGETNEYGKIYNISREQWYIDNNNTNTIGTLQANKLANALPNGFEYFYFWMYNGTGTAYNFHLAGDVSGAWVDSKDSIPMKAGEWTQITISAEDIALNKNGQWYVYILGGDGAGAAKSGWKISTIYAGPSVEYVYTDHADVKNVIALINALPQTITLADRDAVNMASAAYEALTDAQKTLITNINKLTAATAVIVNIEKANEVVALIDAINARDIDETLVSAARAAYDVLEDSVRSYVTNLDKLEGYEAELAKTSGVSKVNEMIANLPDSVVMPDHLVFVSRIEAARDAYEALSDDGKSMVENYAKLRNLLSSIKGYTTVYKQSVDGVNVIPSYVPGGYASSIGGTATMGYDSYYGDYLKVTSNAGGRAAIQFKNFPDVSMYSKLYFNIRVVGASCDIYLSDGITNDGWGDGWHNTWSTDGFWTNNSNWIQKEVVVSTGIFTSNWALGLRTNSTGVSFEITDIIGWAPELGTNTGLTFGNFADTGSVNEYGAIYNFTQGWASGTDMGAFNQNALSRALASGHDSLHFWIYNPNDSAVNFQFTGEMNGWNPIDEYTTNLPAKAWKEVVITSDIIEQGTQGVWYVCVTSGAGTAGWQISPIYSYNSQATSDDAIAGVQTLIGALNTETPSEESVTAARKAYEALNEGEKQFVNIDNLIACEAKLYDMVDEALFIIDGVSDYKIYYEKGNKEYATFMQEQFEKATGASLPLISARPENITQYRYAIVLGYQDLAQNLGWTDYQLSEAGYAVKKIGRTLFIVADSADAYRLGTLFFLQEMIGYDMIAEDCIVYNLDEYDPSYLPEFDDKGAPSFIYRQQQTYMTEDELLGMGLQAHTDLWIASAQGWDMHNALHYLPVGTYGNSHPNWFTSDKKQICPTAGGNSAEFNAMVNVIVENMMVQINAKPNIENISFSIMDSAGNDACTCTRCKLYNTLYGEGGFSAAWIDLMNAINAQIQARIGDRKLNVAFLAYRSTEKAPANGDYSLKYRYQINDDGSYTQTNEYLKCDDEVMVWLAPIDGKYAENFNHECNKATLDLIKKWTSLSDNVFLWMYGTNFKNYMYPYNTWQANAENYKILSQLGVKGVWSQSNESEATAFSDLKGYIDSKFMVNVNANYESVLKTYFTNYYGAGATKMREMFDAIVAKCNEIEANNNGLGRGIYDDIENVKGFIGIGSKTYWAKDWCDSLVTLCDEAKAAVNADSSLTAEEKSVIINRITKESLFPRYVLCTTFADKYSSNTRKAMRQAFKADADALGFTIYKEADGALSGLYSDWGV